MQAIDKLKEVTKALKRRGIEAPEKEARIFINYGLNISPIEIYRDNPELSKEQADALENMLNKRLMREPLQYILGYEEFLGLKITVGHGVLIPRPETELTAEYAIKTVKSYELRVKSERQNSKLQTLTSKPKSNIIILDLCTGSGCIALVLAKKFPDAEVFGSDISKTAIRYARKNAEINRIKNVTFLQGNLFEPLKKLVTDYPVLAPCPTDGRRALSGAGGSGVTFDLIISNPPYIRADEIKSLQPEIKNWEPEIAINGGTDGMDFYRELIPSARRFLKDGGLLMFELGAGQSHDIAGIMESAGYTEIKITKDYKGIERIIQARWIN